MCLLHSSRFFPSSPYPPCSLQLLDLTLKFANLPACSRVQLYRACVRTDRQTDRQAVRHTDGLTDRQTDRLACSRIEEVRTDSSTEVVFCRGPLREGRNRRKKEREGKKRNATAQSVVCGLLLTLVLHTQTHMRTYI